MSPSRLMPIHAPVKIMSNSAVRKGGATLFFTIFAFTRLPITVPACFKLSTRRRSIRTEL